MSELYNNYIIRKEKILIHSYSLVGNSVSIFPIDGNIFFVELDFFKLLVPSLVFLFVVVTEDEGTSSRARLMITGQGLLGFFDAHICQFT